MLGPLGHGPFGGIPPPAPRAPIRQSHGGDPVMVRRHRFIPSACDQLESRVVMSHATPGLASVASGLRPHLRVLNRRQQALTAEVNQAFDSFQNDYDQARATYFAAIANQTTTTVSADTTNS